MSNIKWKSTKEESLRRGRPWSHHKGRIDFLFKAKHGQICLVTFRYDWLSKPIIYTSSTLKSKRNRSSKKRRSASEWNQIINEEVEKLQANGSIREVQYPDRLANMVMVRKKNGKWRVCINFTYLKKACLKDPFPPLHKDMIVDATKGYEWSVSWTHTRRCTIKF